MDKGIPGTDVKDDGGCRGGCINNLNGMNVWERGKDCGNGCIN